MSRNSASIFTYLILTLVSLFMLMPILAMIVTSLKYASAVFITPFQWIPDQFYWDNYRNVMQKYSFITYFKNSIIISITATTSNLFLSSLAGYSLAKFHYKGRDTIFTLIIMGPLENLWVKSRDF